MSYKVKVTTFQHLKCSKVTLKTPNSRNNKSCKNCGVFLTLKALLDLNSYQPQAANPMNREDGK